jgi:RNA polymerase sigma factor (sigma-70 family)
MASAPLGTALRQIHRLFEEGAVGGLTDGQLLERFLDRRDERAFETLVERHSSMVLAICRRSLDDPGDVDDAFQATFLVLARRASTVRVSATLASWLFVVARRTCTMANRTSARRRQTERRAAEQRPVESRHDGESGELAGLICDEVARLPDAYRLPVVLCLLEGRTRAEAAEQLQWTEDTVRGRLARARQRLRVRLARRGLAPLAALATLGREARASSNVPGPLIEATARLATAPKAWGSSVASVAIARKVLGASILAKSLKIAASLLAIGVATGLAASTRREPAASVAMPVPAQKAADDAKVVPAAKAELTEVRGRVIDMGGRPVAGAKLFLLYYRGEQAKPFEARGVSGLDGSFRFSVDRSKLVSPELSDHWASATIWAEAPGFGPDWVRAESATRGDLTLRLPRSGPEFRGRVLDLEGRPVAGAKIEVDHIGTTPGEDLTPALGLWKSKPDKWNEIISKSLGLTGTGMGRFATTDAEGRFRLEGFGQERVFGVVIEGPTIAKTWAWVVPRDPAIARELSEATVEDQDGKRVRYATVYGTSFDHLAAPSRPIVGVVREKGTGKPVAGAYLSDAGSRGFMTGLAATRSDAEGKYRLEGVAKASTYQICASEGHHFMEIKDVSDTTGLGPIAVDLEMRRGIQVRGKVTDKVTGRPLRGGAECFLLPDNPNPPEATHGGFGFGEEGFSLVVPPGKSLICLRAEDDRYVNAHTAESNGNKMFMLKTNPPGCRPSWFHAIIPVDLKDDAENVEINAQLDPGVGVSGKIEGPDGQPLPGVMLLGLDKTIDLDEPLPTAEFEARGIDPRRGRVLIFEHAAKKLGKAITVKGDHPESPIVVRLQAPGSLSGRVVDETGRPRAGLNLNLDQAYRQSHVPYGWSFGRSLAGSREATTDPDGRFRFEGLIDGLEYDVRIRDQSHKFLGVVAEDASAPPGGSKDLGNLTVRPTDAPRE